MEFEQVLATYKRFKDNGVDCISAAILTTLVETDDAEAIEDDEIALIDWCLGQTTSEAQIKFLNGLKAFRQAQGYLSESQKAALDATKMTIDNFRRSCRH